MALLGAAATFGLGVPACRAEPPAAPALVGSKTITLHTRDAAPIVIGTVTFKPGGAGRTGFTLAFDAAPFTDHFLSMREFKCIGGPQELWCHVPYPHRAPMTVSADDLAWLEHALMFFYKLPNEFGAKLWNGIYFQLAPNERGLVGTPQAIDLNHIAAPPDAPDVPPYRKALRDAIAPGARWATRITIE